MESKNNSYWETYLDNLSEDLQPAIKWGVPLGLSASLIIFGISYGIARKFHSTPNDISPIEQRVNTKDIRVYQEGKGRDVTKYIDEKPFGSLDRVIIAKNEKASTIKPNDSSFKQYRQRHIRNIRNALPR